MVDDGEPVAQALGFVHVVGGKQHGAAGALKLAHDLPQLAPALRIEARGRLVEKKNFRIAHQRRRDRQPLPLAARELSHPGVGLLL